MSDTLASLRSRIEGVRELGSVVRTMKALAASSIGQYERAVESLGDYCRTVELGLGACFRESHRLLAPEAEDRARQGVTGAVVIGSDQGLVGQFNDVLRDCVLAALGNLTGEHLVWVVGERISSRLADKGVSPAGLLQVPQSVAGIGPLVGNLLLRIERAGRSLRQVFVFYNSPSGGAAYEPVFERLLPLDHEWQQSLTRRRWPTRHPAEIRGDTRSVLQMLVREFLFGSLYRAVARSLASEHASRLSAMQRAEKNIGELKSDLEHAFHRQRQSAIDEELFDVISGYEASFTRRKESGGLTTGES